MAASEYACGGVNGIRVASSAFVQTCYGAVVKDGDEQLVIVPESKTMEFYQYLRGYGFSFTIDCRGICEDNIFCFPETENTEKLRLIVGRFGLQ